MRTALAGTAAAIWPSADTPFDCKSVKTCQWLLVQSDFMRSIDTGYETMQIVRVDQRFVFHKPIVAGKVLHVQMEVHSIVERFGADIVVTKNIAYVCGRGRVGKKLGEMVVRRRRRGISKRCGGRGSVSAPRVVWAIEDCRHLSARFGAGLAYGRPTGRGSLEVDGSGSRVGTHAG